MIIGTIIAALIFPKIETSKVNLYDGEKSIRELTRQNYHESFTQKNVIVIAFNKPNNTVCEAFASEYIEAVRVYKVSIFITRK